MVQRIFSRKNCFGKKVVINSVFFQPWIESILSIELVHLYFQHLFQTRTSLTNDNESKSKNGRGKCAYIYHAEPVLARLKSVHLLWLVASLFVKGLNNEHCSSSSPQGLVFSAPASVSLCFHRCSNKRGESNRAHPSLPIRIHSHCWEIQNGHTNKSDDFCIVARLERISNSFAI